MRPEVPGDIEIYLIVSRGDGRLAARLTYQISVSVDPKRRPTGDDVTGRERGAEAGGVKVMRPRRPRPSGPTTRPVIVAVGEVIWAPAVTDWYQS